MARRLSLLHIYRLGVKELWSLWRDPIMLVLIVYTFTFAIYAAATAMPDSLRNAPIAIVDEDGSVLSGRISAAFYPPHFLPAASIDLHQVDPLLDNGKYTFVLDIPPDFQRDVLAGKAPTIQLNIDATRMSQAFTGNAYVQQIVMAEINEFVQHYRSEITSPIDLAIRARFNPALTESWFGSIMELINQITALSIILTGAALIREREHGTVEHLLVMPVTPAEIMLAKIWSMGLVVLCATSASLLLVIHGALQVPIEGSIALFLACTTLHLFATTSMGIFLATVARSMPQFGLLIILFLLPLEMLSGGLTPRESMPAFARYIMTAAPTTHFVSAAQAILYRAADIRIVWPQMLTLLVIGSVLFALSLARFRKALSSMA